MFATEYMPAADTIEIVCGDMLTDRQRADAIALLYDGFQRKIDHMMLLTSSAEQAKRVLAATIDFRQGLFALAKAPDCEGETVLNGARVCGLLMMNFGGRCYFRLDWRLARKEFGWFGALFRYLNLCLIHCRRRPADELGIEAVAVAEECRGLGIGTKLMAAADEFAAEHGYRTLLLEVVDTNPRAKALYQRLGYEQKRTNRTGWLTRRAGFTAYDTMVKHVAVSATS